MIFVTGGTGMLGSYLMLELLKQGKSIKASKRKSSTLRTTEIIFKEYSKKEDSLLSKINWIDLDLFDQNGVEKELSDVTEIYHCAAQINSSTKNKATQVYNNQRITENLINAALNKNIDKFCHVSSISALGNSIDGELISESTAWKEHKNNSTYSTSKYYSEMEVWRGIAEGLNALIVNPSIILGIGDWGKGSANLFDKVFHNIKYYTKGSSGFVGGEDVAKIMIQLMNCETCFGQNYIVSAENINFKQLFDKMATALKTKKPSKYATPTLTQFAWKLDWLKSKVTGIDPLITKESARTAHKKLTYNNSKLLETIPYTYHKIDDIIKEIAEVYLKYKVDVIIN